MSDLLLGLSPEFLYFQGKTPKRINELHNPYFLAFTPKDVSIENARTTFIDYLEKNQKDNQILSKITRIGDVENYRSFCDFREKRNVFKVYTKESYVVPEVSDYLFFEQGFYTAEHDIPYQQRALTDLAANDTTWLFDTNGEEKTLKVLIYDIEITQFEEGKRDSPIDIIGYATFTIRFTSKKNLKNEDFQFDIIDCPLRWEDIEVKQLVSNNLDEEIDNLSLFCTLAKDCDIISGHNIIGFDNFQVYGRIQWILKNCQDQLSSEKRQILQKFVSEQCRLDRSFHFGVGSEVVQIYPTSFDTYLAARKFYSFLDEFNLKSLAPFLGIHIPDRIYLSPSQIKLDERTLQYNKHDVQEQIGVTLNLIQQALPLAFTTCMPFDMLLPTGAVNMWDHMAMIRSAYQKKIMPPICRVQSITQALLHDFRDCNSKNDIVRSAKKMREQLSKDFRRVVKYGEEMPEWVEYPYVIYNENATEDEETLNYHMPGGMTIKPDKEANSHFIPWYYVVVADVGAMYPTILKAMNVGADTVRLAKKNEKTDEYIWLKKLPAAFFEKSDINWRKVTSEDAFADQGFLLGIHIDKTAGVVNCAMTGIMNMIAKVKKELKVAKTKGKKADVQRLQMMYQSLKGARNAGTHGILSAPTVTGRQFNLWGAAAITTKGQMILFETLQDLQKKKIRVVYGDTDGIYLGCSRSAGNLPLFCQALGVSCIQKNDTWLTKPEVAFDAIKQCNKKWQSKLNYSDFELEPEVHDAMIFVKHKNYLIFDTKDDHVEMTTKGNNFKGSDKANIARIILDELMINVMRENYEWNDEETVRKAIKNSIKSKTKEAILKLDLTKVDLDDLTLVQSVQPAKQYKLNQDGSSSVFGLRSAALEKLLGHSIRTRMKLKFVVTKKPLPGIVKPSKSGVKPIDYMYPIDLLKDTRDIDLDWYKKMIENYIEGAFGLSDIAATQQKGLDAWM